MIKDKHIIAGHDIGSGGLITTLLELCFANPNTGADIDLTAIAEADTIKLLFSENIGIVFQAAQNSTIIEDTLRKSEIPFLK